MSIARFKFVCLAALTLLAGCQRDISGTYVARDPDALAWLQLVRTPDNHVTGQLVISYLKPGGIERKSVSLTGAVDGENITLTGNGLFGLQTSSLSGTISGGTLTLAGADAAPMVLKRSSLDAYQAQMNALNARAQAALAAREAETSRTNAARQAEISRENLEREQRNFVQTVDALVDRMQRFDSEADVHLGRFRNVEKGYQTITAKMTAYVERERQLASNPNAGVTRSQLSVAANQASMATDQMHMSGESLESSLEGNIKPIGDEATGIDSACRAGVSNGLTPAELQAHNEACTRLQAALPKFREKYNAIKAGLAHLEQVYTREKTAQDALLKTAESLD